MGSRGTLKSADGATTHGCLDWRSEVIFKLNPKRAGLFGPISQPGGFSPQDLGNRLTKYQVCGTSG